MTEKKGFKDSRIQGFKWFAWYFFSKHKSEGGEAEGRRQRTEVRGQRAEDRGQRSEVRGQRTEGRGQRVGRLAKKQRNQTEG